MHGRHTRSAAAYQALRGHSPPSGCTGRGSASLDGEPAKLTEIATPGGGRAHLLRCDAGS
jgi:hypothetical protein